MFEIKKRGRQKKEDLSVENKQNELDNNSEKSKTRNPNQRSMAMMRMMLTGESFLMKK